MTETGALLRGVPAASEPVRGRGAIIGGRWRFLAETSAALERSLDYAETLGTVVRLVVPTMADYAAIALFDDEGLLTWGSSAHCDPQMEPLVGRLRSFLPRLAVEDNPIATALQSGETQFIQTVDEAALRSIARDDTHLALLRQLAPTSLIILQLAARGQVLGSLHLATTQNSTRHYTERDVAIANEVARRVALALDRALLFRAAEQAAHLREQMVAVVSHDLKNPLATIQMAVSFLLEELVPEDEPHNVERAQLHAIHRSAERMYRLIHDLLDVAAIEAGRFQVQQAALDVDGLVAEVLELLCPLALAKHIELVADVSQVLPQIAADRERLLQVFSNVVGNALKFTPENGKVEISVTAREDVVEFAVRDTGPGIPSTEIPHVFDRFWQAKKTARGGSGLGLAIAKGIIDAHGGSIRAESETGHGSCFRFTLPIA